MASRIRGEPDANQTRRRLGPPPSAFAEDEFIYVIEGAPTLFPAGGDAHHLANRTDVDAVILEIGDRTPGDEGSYPDDDIKALMSPNGTWRFTHKDGGPY